MPAGTNPYYPVDITPVEQSAGFSLMEIANPEAHYAFSLPTIQAVVCEIDVSNRVVKMKSPRGDISYVHQRKGYRAIDSAQSDPRWSPVFETLPDPIEAVKVAILNRDTPDSLLPIT